MALRVCAGLFLLQVAVACMAQMTSVTAPSGSLTMNGVAIASGTASFSVVDAVRGGAISVRAGDKIFAPQAITCTVTGGAISSCSVPDLSVAIPMRSNVTMAYNITVFDMGSHGSYALTNVGGVQGATWALNTYAPAQNAPVVATALSTGSTVPSACRGAALFYTQTNPVSSYACVGNVFVLQTSSGGSSVSITWRNAYGSGTTYAVNDAVSYGGSSYISLQASNTGHQPDTSSSWWSLLAAKGSDGDVGVTGPAGPAPNCMGIVKSDGAAASCATADTDYVKPSTLTAQKGAVNGIASLDANAQLPAAQLPLGLISVAQIGTLFGNWDSYGYGNGPQNPARYAPFQLISADVPAPFVNLSVNGYTLNQIANQAFLNYQPNQLGLPDVGLPGAGENDNTACSSATAQCGYSFKEMKLANMLHWLIPPTFSNSIYASNFTKTSGTWTNDAAIYGAFNKTAAGYPVTSSAGGVLTVSIPSSSATKIHLHYIAKTANTGSFTWAVTDTSGTTNAVDESTGTTTFSGAPLGSNPGITGYGMYTQEITVTPNIAHTLTITASGIVEIARVTWNGPAATAPKNIVYDFNVNQLWTNYLVWDTIDAALDSQLRAEGFLVGSVDIQNGTSTTSTMWSSISSTAFPQAGVPFNAAGYSTMATATCTASRNANHPNECGAMDIYRNFLNAQANLGIIISRVSLGAKYTEQSGLFYSPPVLQNPKFAATLADLTFLATGYATYNSGTYFNGVIGWQDSSTAGSRPWSQKYMQGPVSAPTGNFWWCGADIVSYTNAQQYLNGNQSVKWCDDPAGNSYRNIFVSNIGTAISSATLAPTTGVVHVSGTNAYSSLTPPAGVCDKASLACSFTLIPDGAFTLATGGTASTTAFTFNTSSTAVVGRPMVLTCDPTAQRCYASY